MLLKCQGILILQDLLLALDLLPFVSPSFQILYVNLILLRNLIFNSECLGHFTFTSGCGLLTSIYIFRD